MALSTKIDPREEFKDNDVFTSLDDPDEQNPYANVQSASIEDIDACGRFRPFDGPFFKLRPNQYGVVLDAFSEIEITESVYEPEEMQTWMLWLFLLAQIPPDVVMQYCHKNNIIPQSLVGTMPSLHNHGFT